MARVLVDMDCILVDLLPSWLEIYNRDNGTSYQVKDITDWGLTSISPTGEVYKILEQPGFFEDLPPIPGAIQALEALLQRGHAVYTVSAPVNARNYAEKVRWLNAWCPFLTAKNIVFCHDKAIVQGDWLIDDAPKNAEAYRTHHPGAKIVTIEYEYNKHCTAYDLKAVGYQNPEAAWETILKAIG